MKWFVGFFLHPFSDSVKFFEIYRILISGMIRNKRNGIFRVVFN